MCVCVCVCVCVVLICDFKKSVFKASEEGCIGVTSVCSGEAHLCLVTEEAEGSSSLSTERALARGQGLRTFMTLGISLSSAVK